MLPSLIYLIRGLLRLIIRDGTNEVQRELEVLALCHELKILRRQVKRPRLPPHDRALLSACARKMPRTSWSCFFVTPKILLR